MGKGTFGEGWDDEDEFYGRAFHFWKGKLKVVKSISIRGISVF